MRNKTATVFVWVFVVALAVVPAMAQTVTNPSKANTEVPVSVAALTEVESLRMQIAGLLDELTRAGEEKRAIEKQRDQLRLQLAMAQTAPVREGFTFDWSVGAFRHLATGKVWDFEKKALVEDSKTPKAGGGL